MARNDFYREMMAVPEPIMAQHAENAFEAQRIMLEEMVRQRMMVPSAMRNSGRSSLVSDYMRGETIDLKKLPKDPGKAVESKPEVENDYLELAEAIGLDSPAVLDEQLKVCLKQRKIFVYDLERVKGFLKREANKDREAQLPRRVVWLGLRKKDGGRQYIRPVPGHALAKVKTLIENFSQPNKLCFEVSEYEVVRPDPFLSVRIEGSETRFVIAHWDEPNFRMED